MESKLPVVQHDVLYIRRRVCRILWSPGLLGSKASDLAKQCGGKHSLIVFVKHTLFSAAEQAMVAHGARCPWRTAHCCHNGLRAWSVCVHEGCL